MSNILYLNQSVRDLAANARCREFMADDFCEMGAPNTAAESMAMAEEYWRQMLQRARRADLPMPLAAARAQACNPKPGHALGRALYFNCLSSYPGDAA